MSARFIRLNGGAWLNLSHVQLATPRRQKGKSGHWSTTWFFHGADGAVLSQCEYRFETLAHAAAHFLDEARVEWDREASQTAPSDSRPTPAVTPPEGSAA